MPGKKPCFIIAEIGVNHNGSLPLAEELIDIAASSGADAAKFQTFDPAKLVRPGTRKASYQKRQTGDGDQNEMLEKLQLSEADHERLANYCAARNIEFMSTPFDRDAANFLKAIGVERIKLPSGDIDNLPMIRQVASLDLPVIMSTGMADLKEVEFAKRSIEAEWASLGLMQDVDDRLVVLHCTSNYPALPEDVNLSAMTTMGDALDCPVGYSDHTSGTAIPVAAVALGAVVIEKHITLDKNLPGPDHAASLNPVEFHEMVEQIRAVEAARGDGVKAPRPTEVDVRAVVRRSMTVARVVEVGTEICAEDLIMLRPADGISPSQLDKVVGRTAARRLEPGALLNWDDLSA